jgi:hypothetical protein
MLGGVATALAWKAMGPQVIDPVLPGFAVSALLMVGVSLVTPRPPGTATGPYFGSD